ncbi:MAG: motility protein A [Candidatus Nanopelagicales bacterium]
MDIATILGLLGAIGIIVWAILLGGSLGAFVDIPSVAIVIGGTISVVLSRHTLAEFIGHLTGAVKAFMPKSEKLETLIELLPEYGTLARREGMLALEPKAAETRERFLKSGLMLLVDGTDEGALTSRLRTEMDAMDRRHGAVIAAWQGWIDVAPAMGMIGTLVGLVQMLGNMSDPKSIGPAMAVALLTTLYGAFIANVVAGPITNKLKIYHAEEMIYREAVLAGLQGIARGDNPRMIGDSIVALLPPAAQAKLVKA